MFSKGRFKIEGFNFLVIIRFSRKVMLSLVWVVCRLLVLFCGYKEKLFDLEKILYVNSRGIIFLNM